MLKPIFWEKLIVLWFVFGSILCNDDDEIDRIHFLGPISSENHVSPNSIPLETRLEIAREFSQIETMKDFLSRVQGIPDDLIPANVSINNRISGDARSSGEIGKPAICSPELHPVSLKNSSISPSAIYFPSCTRILQCGGCCGDILFSCQPVDKVTRHFQVIVAEYNIEKRVTFNRKIYVPVEEHTKCRCQCKKKAEDCNEKQIYLPNECRCACRYTDDESKCLRNNDTQIWDERSCSCTCRGSHECTTGYHYDHANCSCKRIGTLRRPVDVRKGQNPPRYDSELHNSGHVRPIFTINADDPRRRHRDDPE